MAYADYDYYKDVFKGELEEEQATKLLGEASDQVDRLAHGRIRSKGFDNLTEFQQANVKKAVCYQSEFIDKYSEYLNMPINGYSAGDISLSFSEENKGRGGIIADKKTLDYLSQTGLTSRRL